MQLRRELYESLHEPLWTRIGSRIYSKLDRVSETWQGLSQDTQPYFNPVQDIVPVEYLAATGSLFDCCYSILNCSGQELWEAYQLCIGYDRICQEFNASELDRWQKYRLLKIDSSIDDEPVYLLTMTCPSTGHPPALRVPPNMRKAR